jgi:hypothetical protein
LVLQNFKELKTHLTALSFVWFICIEQFFFAKKPMCSMIEPIQSCISKNYHPSVEFFHCGDRLEVVIRWLIHRINKQTTPDPKISFRIRSCKVFNALKLLVVMLNLFQHLNLTSTDSETSSEWLS